MLQYCSMAPTHTVILPRVQEQRQDIKPCYRINAIDVTYFLVLITQRELRTILNPCQFSQIQNQQSHISIL